MRKLFFLTLLFSGLLFSVKGQDSFNKRFLEANTLMEDKLHNVALPIWLELLGEQPSNANIGYKVGLCYIHSANDKKKALTYLVNSTANVANNYDPFSANEDRAPVEAFFYLGKAYHINYKLDEAIRSFERFKEQASPKHYLYQEVNHTIEQCHNAMEAVKNPKNTVVENLGPRINGEYSDFSPVLSIDESKIYFTSRRIRKDSSNAGVFHVLDGGYFEDIYVSDNYDGVWSEPKLLNINTQGHEAVINTSVDGKTLFIYKDDNGDGNLYTTTLTKDDYWSPPVKLGSDINLESFESHVHVSPDGEVLYYVSDRKKGKGGKDIYRCKKLPTGEWARSQNLGDVLNTPYHEDGVFLHPDGKTMYFSSQGHKSIGGYDIFYSEMDENGNWGTPVNLGYPINTTDDDVFFVTSADGKRGYYSSFQEKGYGEKDIYRITMPDAEERLLTLLTGSLKVKGEDTIPSDALVIVTDATTGLLVGKYVPRKRDGKFSIILEPDNNYHIEYTTSKYTEEEDLFVPPISAYQEINRSINLQDIVLDENSDVVEVKDKKTPITERADVIPATVDEKAASVDVTTTKNNASKVSENTTVSSPKVKSNTIIASYQQFFDYNMKDINTSDSKYIDMINKATKRAKDNGKVLIDIESSASHVPTITFKSNAALAYKRATDAQKTVMKSLIKNGVEKEKIVLNNIDSSARGPKYNNDYKNTSIYKKYQYVIVKIK